MCKAAAECQPPLSCQSSAKTVRIFKPAFSPHFQTGANNRARERFTARFIVGKTIEIACMGLTPDGRFRHPRFIRLRLDK